LRVDAHGAFDGLLRERPSTSVFFSDVKGKIGFVP
jgi:hypothetical protein